MKNLLLFVCIFYSSFVIASENITLASQEVLRQRLSALGLDHFVERTHIDHILDKKNLHPLDVVTTVQYALYDYSKNTQKMPMGQCESIIIKEILKDHPKAIAYLQTYNLLD